MPTQMQVEYIKSLYEELLAEYKRTGDEQLPAAITYLSAAWMAMRLLKVRGKGKGDER